MADWFYWVRDILWLLYLAYLVFVFVLTYRNAKRRARERQASWDSTTVEEDDGEL